MNPPEPMERGGITSKDLTDIRTADECVQLIRKWANEVYNAWCSDLPLVKEIAEGFLERHDSKATNR